MAGSPELPRVTMGQQCRKELEPLTEALIELIKAANPGIGMLFIAHSAESGAKAKNHLVDAKTLGLLDSARLQEIYDLIGDVPKHFPVTEEDVEQVEQYFKNAKEALTMTLEALLDAAVDCECREAKAIESKLGDEALATILGPEAAGNGMEILEDNKGRYMGKRPRILTEITGEFDETPCLLRVGTIVVIYEDPVSKKKPEGEARLIKCLVSRGEDLEYWTVEFLSDRSRVDRWIDVGKRSND